MADLRTGKRTRPSARSCAAGAAAAAALLAPASCWLLAPVPVGPDLSAEGGASADAGDGAISEGRDSGPIDIDQGLVGYWKLDEDAGGVAADSSGRGNAGKLVNGPQWSDGRRGLALSFDGLDDAVIVAVSPSLDALRSAFTAAAWIKRTDPDDGGRRWSHILSKGDEGATVGNTFVLDLDDAKRFFVRIADGTAAQWTVGVTTLLPNTWHHVAATFDGSTIAVYVDGALERSASKTLSGPLVRAGDLAIGRQSPQGCSPPWNGCWKGLLDEVRLYDRALSAAEIAALASP